MLAKLKSLLINRSVHEREALGHFLEEKQHVPGWTLHNRQEGWEIKLSMHSSQQEYASHPQSTPICTSFETLHNTTVSFCHMEPQSKSLYKALKQDPSITARQQESGKHRDEIPLHLSPSCTPAAEILQNNQDAFSQCPKGDSMLLALLSLS